MLNGKASYSESPMTQDGIAREQLCHRRIFDAALYLGKYLHTRVGDGIDRLQW
jgi:hypothetical protein